LSAADPGSEIRVFVIAVSGFSGAGKTSLVERTADLLGNASRLHFDDYRSVSTYPQDLKAWLDAGADPDAWETPRLASDLRRLRSGEAVGMLDGTVVEPSQFIVLEEPFGRSRRETSELIDLVAHLEVPADVLLARRLLRLLEDEAGGRGPELIERLIHDLRHHLAAGRELAAAADAHVRRTADLVLDGLKPVDELAATLIAEVRRVRGTR
jgi:uridine kinase